MTEEKKKIILSGEIDGFIIENGVLIDLNLEKIDLRKPLTIPEGVTEVRIKYLKANIIDIIMPNSVKKVSKIELYGYAGGMYDYLEIPDTVDFAWRCKLSTSELCIRNDHGYAFHVFQRYLNARDYPKITGMPKLTIKHKKLTDTQENILKKLNVKFKYEDLQISEQDSQLSKEDTNSTDTEDDIYRTVENEDYKAETVTIPDGISIVDIEQSKRVVLTVEVPDSVKQIRRFQLNDNNSDYKCVEIPDTVTFGNNCAFKTSHLIIRNNTGKAFKTLKAYLKVVRRNCDIPGDLLLFIKGEKLSLREEKRIRNLGVHLRYISPEKKETIEQEPPMISEGQRYIFNSDQCIISKDTLVAFDERKDDELVPIFVGDVYFTLPENINAVNVPMNRGLKIYQVGNIIFPKNVKEIRQAFFNGTSANNEYASIEIHDGVFFERACRFCTKNLIVNNINGNAIGAIIGYLSMIEMRYGSTSFYPKKILIKGLRLTPEDFKKLDFKKLNIELIQEQELQENAKENIDNGIFDEEINDLITKILSLSEILHENYRIILLKRVDEMLKSYRNAIEGFNPDLEDTDDVIKLTSNGTIEMTRKLLLTKLLGFLEVLKSSKYLTLLETIENYQCLIDKDIKVPRTINSLEDKVKLIILIGKNTENGQIEIDLRTILKELSFAISEAVIETCLPQKTSMALDTPLVNYERKLEERIDELFTKCGRYSLIDSALKGFGDSFMARSFRYVSRIVESLDDENAKIYNGRLESARSLYSYEREFSKETEEEIIKKLMEMTKDLHKIVGKSTYFKRILNSINNALDSLNRKKVKRDSSLVGDLCAEIKELLKSDSIVKDKKYTYKRKMEEILKAYKDVILGDNLDDFVMQLRTRRETSKRAGVDSSVCDYSNLSDLTVLELELAKELYRIKNKIETYISKKKEYKTYIKRPRAIRKEI